MHINCVLHVILVPVWHVSLMHIIFREDLLLAIAPAIPAFIKMELFVVHVQLVVPHAHPRLHARPVRLLLPVPIQLGSSLVI